MAQDGILDNHPPRKVLRAPSPQLVPTPAQSDLVEKIRILEYASVKGRQFRNFALDRPFASSELRVTIEVQPYFESFRDFVNFLMSLRIQHLGANYEQDDLHGRVYKHQLNGVSMRFYRSYGASQDTA